LLTHRRLPEGFSIGVKALIEVRVAVPDFLAFSLVRAASHAVAAGHRACVSYQRTGALSEPHGLRRTGGRKSPGLSAFTHSSLIWSGKPKSAVFPAFSVT